MVHATLGTGIGERTTHASGKAGLSDWFVVSDPTGQLAKIT